MEPRPSGGCGLWVIKKPRWLGAAKRERTMITPKCPACNKPVTAPVYTIVTAVTDGLVGPIPRGAAYLCQDTQCRAMLPITPIEPRG